ncbi:hypothetical protein GCM10010174_43840 [Kutzneria viridogrisea]|uniref:Carboxypeptidase regulatory-like domain-containing protein n=1 Tax=Kutzneria viridogrisea TaxID=47990 RepID=A0ABR6BPH9_9PSEU|nr:hypothetical protein [Kutzneria viridogrisea]
MTTMRPLGPASANEPLDEVDFLILDQVRELYTQADPPPVDLVERIRLAVSMAGACEPLARRREVLAAGMRGTDQRRLITFDAESVTVMISVQPNRDGTVRIDGWLTPPAGHPVELRTARIRMRTTADADGRFVLDGVKPGTAQLVVRPLRGRSVTTPAIVL